MRVRNPGNKPDKTSCKALKMQASQYFAVFAAAVILFSLLPAAIAFASSDNFVDRVLQVWPDHEISLDDVSGAPVLRIAEVTTGAFNATQEFMLTLIHAEWNMTQEQIDEAGGYLDIVNNAGDYYECGKVLSITRESDATLVVIAEADHIYGADCTDKAAFRFPLIVKIIAEGAAQIVVDARDSSLSNGTYTFANAAEGQTHASIEKVSRFERSGILPLIQIDETRIGVLPGGENVISITLPDGYSWENQGDVYFSGGFSGSVWLDGSVNGTNFTDGGKILNLHVDIIESRQTRGSIFLQNFGIRADMDATYGNVTAVFSGTKITGQEIIIAKHIADAPDPNAIKIYNARDLWDVRNNLNGSYILMNDIVDLPAINGGEWAPIGVNSTNASAGGFTGVFDGQGYKIYGLKITEECQYAGLFGYADNAAIKNAGLVGTYINIESTNTDGATFAGGICGYNAGSSINGCYNTGSVSADVSDSADTGGICGYNFGGSISNCDNTGSVSVSASGIADTGGICGYSAGGSVSNCYNTGDVSVFSVNYAPAGGICGSNNGHVSNCYNSGGISAVSSSLAEAGGIAGRNLLSSIADCYNTGDVSAAGALTCAAGGICGRSLVIVGSVPDIYNCYWMSERAQTVNGDPLEDKDKRIIGSEADTATGRLAAAQMKEAANFAGFDFTGVWDISPERNGGYPFLRAFAGFPYAIGDVSGDGRIDMQDVLMIYQHFRGKIALAGPAPAAADVNADGEVNMADVLLLYQYFRGKIGSL